MSIFKEKDTVYHWKYGKGIVVCTKSVTEYPVMVRFESNAADLPFTSDGKFWNTEQPTLSFTPYDLIKGGFSQEIPKPEIEKGTPVFVKYKTSIYWHVGIFNCWNDVGDIGVTDLDGITRYFKEYSLENPLI